MVEKRIGEKTAPGFGVIELWNKASIASGIYGVGVMVAVSVTFGVSVMVGVNVIVGDTVMVGTIVTVGVIEAVGEGGKY